MKCQQGEWLYWFNDELDSGHFRGRSSQHQWNEAVQTVTYELFASKFAKDGKQKQQGDILTASHLVGDMVTAGAFKRAAHLALGSLRRWR